MSATYKIYRDGDTKTFDDEQQFEDTKDLLEQNGVEFEVEKPDTDEIEVADGGEEIETVDAEIVDHTENGHEESEQETQEESEEADTLDTDKPVEPTETQDTPDAMDMARNRLADPLETLPGWMKSEVQYSDRGDSKTSINKRGCEVISNYLDLDVDFEVLDAAPETGFEYAYYKCTVTKPDGKSFDGYGTARADGNDQGDDAGWKIEMMAQTRAYKRAVKFATGDGIQAFVEAQE